jgi:hypothetical protein
MKALPEDMVREIDIYLRATAKAHAHAMALLRAPLGHKPEELEDALNELQDQAFQARRAFRVGAVR